MKTLAPLIITLLLVLPFATPAPAADAPNFQTVCPVMGGKINRTLFVDHDGKRVYFCCPGGCADKFKADPAKYLDKMKADGVELEKTPVPQTVCPVMGGKIDKTLFVDHKGSRVYFCCPGGCADKFKADPAKYLDKMKADGVELEKTPASDDAAPKTERAPGTKMHHGM